MANLTDIQKILFEYQDSEYKKFSENLSPTVNPDSFIGVRVPEIRNIAKQIKLKDALNFFNELPHKYNEENLLHGFLIQYIKDYNLAVTQLDKFLPYVNNWAVCDTMAPKVFSKHKEELYSQIKKWITDKHTYTIRFGIDMLMTFYLDNDFDPIHLILVSTIKSSEYYVNMMISWYYATALAKQWSATIALIETKTLSPWIQNKTIQKAVESRRISDDKKSYLKSLKIK